MSKRKRVDTEKTRCLTPRQLEILTCIRDARRSLGYSPTLQEIADELGKYMGGFAFPFALNLIALQLAGAILDLDDVIADHLVEERVPRIEPARGNEPAA